MTLSNTKYRVAYNGDDSTTAFPVTFVFIENSQVQAVLRSSAGVETTWTEGSEYTLTGGGGATGTLTATTAPATGETLTIIRNMPLTQETDYPEGGTFPAASHELALDFARMVDQQQQEEIDRAPKFPVTDGSGAIGDWPVSGSRANKLAAFDSAGKPTAQVATDNSTDAVTATGSTTSRLLADRFADEISVLDYGATGDGVTDDKAAIDAAVTAASAGDEIYFPKGTYLVDGANGITIAKNVSVRFHPGAKLLFNSNSAEYLKFDAVTDVILDNIRIDGGTVTVRGILPGILLDEGCARIIMRTPRVEDVAGAGIIVRGSVDVQILSPYVRGCLADGIHITTGAGAICERVTVSSPLTDDTGDDAVSVVSYDVGAGLCTDITVTGHVSRNSATAGLTIAGGQRVYYDGVVYSPGTTTSHSGVRIEEDNTVGAETREVRDCMVNAVVYDAAGRGAYIGKNVFDSEFNLVINGSDDRGLIIGSGGSSNKTMRNTVSARINTTASIGIDMNGVEGMVCPALHAENCDSYGLNITGNTSEVAIGVLSLKNNNLGMTAGVDNGIINGSDIVIGAVLPIDDAGNCERGLQINSATRVHVGAFMGVENGTILDPGIISTNTDVYKSPRILTGSATYDPGSLVDGAGATTTVTVTGAALGDFAEASFSNDLQGITVTAWVSSANTVSVRFQNESGGTLDLASGTLRAMVTRQQASDG